MKIACQTQYDDDWWLARQGVPTASEFDKIITPAKGELSKSADQYACDLIGDLSDPNYLRRVNPPGENFATAAMKTGTKMEPAARSWYEMETGHEVKQVGLMLTDDERFGASPDGTIEADNGGLELKSPNPGTHVMYKLAGVLPDKYKPQVHGQLIVGGFAYVDFCSWVRGLGGFRVRVVPDAYTAKLREALESFWARMLEIRRIVGIPEPVEAPKPEKVKTFAESFTALHPHVRPEILDEVKL